MPQKLTKAESAKYLETRLDPRWSSGTRRAWLNQWVKNVAFMNGRQHLVDDGNGFLRAPNVSPHRVLYKANHIAPAVYRACTKALATSATFAASPPNGSERATNTSFVTNKVLEHMRSITRYDQRKWIAAVWAAVCGSSILRVTWNPNKGVPDRYYLEAKNSRKVVLPQNDDEREALESEGAFKDYAPGEVEVGVCNLLEFYWDEYAHEEGIEGCRWINFRYMTSREALRDAYPDAKVDNIRRGRTSGDDSAYYQHILQIMSSAITGPTGAYALPKGQRESDDIMVDEYYEIPSVAAPRGRMIVRAGDSILHSGDNLYAQIRGIEPWETLPAVKLDWLVRPGSFVGKSMVEEMISAQFHYNKARAATIEHQNIYGHPSVFLYKGSGLPSGQWALEPGLVYDTNVPPGQKIFEIGPVPTLSKEVAENVMQSMGDMQRLSAQDVQDTNVPGQARSNEGIGMLFKEKDAALLPVARAVLDMDLQAGRKLLAYGKTFYTSRRVIRYAGEDNEIEVMDFDAADINHDIQLVGRPQFFNTPEVQEARIKEFLAAGLWDPVNNPDDKLDILKALQIGTAEEMIHERLQDEKNQRREIREMSEGPVERYLTLDENGQPAPAPSIEDYDDDRTHLKVLRRFMKGDEYRKLDQVRQRIIGAHAEQHNQRLTQAMMQQAMMAQAMGGGGGQKGQPSRPKASAPAGSR